MAVQLSVVVQVRRSTAVPGPLNVAVVAHRLESPNVTCGPETWDQPQLPLEQVPLRSKAVGVSALPHLVWSSPAFAVGFPSIVRFTSSVPLQFSVVVQVRRSTAMPGPLNVAVVAHRLVSPKVTVGPET